MAVSTEESAVNPAPVFNPLDPAFAQDPFPILRDLREADPVLPLPGLGFLVTGHQPAAEMLRRRDGDTRWVEFQQRRMGPGAEHEPYCKGNVNSLLMISGDQHSRVRGTFQRSFSPRLMELLRAPVRDTAHRLIDRFAERGHAELLPEETTLGGHTVPADTPVIMYLSAANHDESWCPHAAEFDTSRAVPADHLAFGAGPHKCPARTWRG
jgi:cytochrome P450